MFILYWGTERMWLMSLAADKAFSSITLAITDISILKTPIPGFSPD